MKRVVNILKAIGLPYAYNHFGQGKRVDPPFICYLMDRSDNFSADGKAYFKKNRIHLELYTDKKAVTLEEKVEEVLDQFGIFYDKSEIYIESERLYAVLYQFTLEVKHEE